MCCCLSPTKMTKRSFLMVGCSPDYRFGVDWTEVGKLFGFLSFGQVSVRLVRLLSRKQ